MLNAWGRQLDCVACGVVLKNKRRGRSRILCGARACELKYRKEIYDPEERRRQYLSWRERCGNCATLVAVPCRRGCSAETTQSENREVPK